MKKLRKASLFALVWVTAASTLVAGTPKWVCLCPNGQTRTRSASTAEGTPGCCCCKGCSGQGGGDSDSRNGQRSPAPKTTQGSCCGQNKGQPTQGNPVKGSGTDHDHPKATKEVGSKLTPDFSADRSNCQKGLVQTKALSLTVQQKKAAEELPSPVPLLLEVATHGSSPPFGAGQGPCAASRFQSPADLVTLLQRFTI
jgi:hypothetical protein